MTEIIIHKKVVETYYKKANFHFQLCDPKLNTKNQDKTWMKTAKSWWRDVDCEKCLSLKTRLYGIDRGKLKWGIYGNNIRGNFKKN